MAKRLPQWSQEYEKWVVVLHEQWQHLGDLAFRSHADDFVQSLSRRLDILSHFVGKIRTVEDENKRQKQTYAWEEEEARVVYVKVRASFKGRSSYRSAIRSGL